MPWILLTLAGIFEIGWAIGLKYTDGFTKLLPTVLTAGSMLVSIVLLGLAVKTLPMGTAYGIWTGIGALGAVIVGILAFQEPVTVPRLIFVGLLLVGIVGLKLTA